MKTRLKRLINILIVLCINIAPVTASEDLYQDGGSWLQVVSETSLKFVDPKLVNGLLWWEGQLRFDNDWGHLYQSMLRSAIGYALNDRATIWLGYAWIPTQNLGRSFSSEQDIWPAFRYVLPTRYGTFMFRTMMEANFLHGNGDQIRIRPRQMIRFAHPLDFEPRLSIIFYDEFNIKVNTTTAGGKSGFEQNLAFAGLGWTVNNHLRLEAGYLNQYLEDPKYLGHNTMHHLITAASVITF